MTTVTAVKKSENRLFEMPPPERTYDIHLHKMIHNVYF